MTLLVARAAIALVWIYQGIWCKVLGRAPRQQEIIATAPSIGSFEAARQVAIAIGILECALAVWVLSGIRPYQAAIVQTIALASMNLAGLFWANRFISHPVRMLLKNLVFLLIIWLAVARIGLYVPVH